MEGVKFLVDDKGNKTAVMLDLDKWGELWEDIYDAMIIESRKNEPSIPWEEVKEELEPEARIGG